VLLADLVSFLGDLYAQLPRIAVSLVFIVAISVIYKAVSLYLSRAAKRTEMQPHVQNSLRLVIRVATIAVAATAILTVFELPTTWFLGSSAIVGAAIGFGSSQTINNMIAGLYVVISRPFKVKDYVKIGDIEGQVEEISINYTKLYTPSFNLLEVPNIQVLNSRILNCTHEGYIKYTFTLEWRHDMVTTNEELTKQCIEPAIEAFHSKHNNIRKPEFYFDTSVAFSRSFKFRLFVPEGDAKSLYVLKPELSEMIISRWDELRKAK